MKLNLEKMTPDQLWELYEEIGTTLADRITAEKHELEHRLAQLQRDLPLHEMAERAETARRRRKYPKVRPKYRNPEVPHETWAGRGKRPRWLVSALSAGSRLEDLLLSPVSTPETN